jgi:subtilisin family serine protease
VTGPEVVLAAPAVDIVSPSRSGRYGTGTGTSDATAILAGAAALVRAKFPTLSAEEVIHRLTATAIDKGPPGRDNEYGYGVVDLVAALTKEVPPLKATTPASAATSTPATSSPAPNGRTGPPLAVIVAIVAVLVTVGAVGVLIAVRRQTAS